MRKVNNKGYTLVELIVVIVIVGIMASSLVVGIKHFMDLNVTYGMQSLQATLDETRYTTMTKGDSVVKCVIEQRNDMYYAIVTTSDTDEKVVKLFDSRYPLYYYSDITSYLVDDTNKITIIFNKNDGSLKSVNYNLANVPISISDNYIESNGVKLDIEQLTGRTLLND